MNQTVENIKNWLNKLIGNEKKQEDKQIEHFDQSWVRPKYNMQSSPSYKKESVRNNTVNNNSSDSTNLPIYIPDTSSYTSSSDDSGSGSDFGGGDFGGSGSGGDW